MWLRSVSIALGVVLGAGVCSAEPAAIPYRVTIDVGDSMRDLASDKAKQYDAAVQRLSGIGLAVLPALTHALRHESERTRVGVVEVLDQIGEPECAPLLIEASRDQSSEVRIDAIIALGSLDDERGRSIIEGLLADPSADIRRAAAAACAMSCRAPAALHRLAEIAVREPPLAALFPARHTLSVMMTDADAERARAAKQAVEDVARPSFASATAHEEKARAALLLADAGDANAVAFLRGSVGQETDPLLRLQMIATLGAADDEHALPVLVEESRDAARRPVVCKALEQLAARKINGAADAAQSCRAALPPRRS